MCDVKCDRSHSVIWERVYDVGVCRVGVLARALVGCAICGVRREHMADLPRFSERGGRGAPAALSGAGTG